MLKLISITNFQSHKNTCINLSDGLNVISGSSDSGKSSIVRAIRWVTENRPTGDSVRNWNCGKKEEMSVGLEFTEGSVCKKKTEGKTKYLIDTKKGSFEFESVRSDVPTEVSEFLDLSEFNTQTQHDPYFLLNDSPGEVAKKLNYLVGLDVIDTIFKNLNSRILFTKRKIDSTNAAAEDINKKIEELSWIDSADIELTNLENDGEKIKNDRKKLEEIKELINRHSIIKKDLDRIQPLMHLEVMVDTIYRDLKNLIIEKEKYSEIFLILRNIEKISSEIREKDKLLKTEKNCSMLKKEILNNISCRQKITDISCILNLISGLKRDIDLEQSNIKNRKEELNKIFSENKICPLCKSKITEDKIKEMLK